MTCLPDLRLRNGSAKFCGSFDPLLNYLLCVAKSLLVGFAIGHTAGEFWDFGYTIGRHEETIKSANQTLLIAIKQYMPDLN